MAKRIINPIAAYEAETQKASLPTAATQTEQTASLRAFLYSHFRKTNDVTALQYMVDIVEKTLPDLKQAPSPFALDLKAFYDFDKPLTDSHAVQVATELKVRHIFVIFLSPNPSNSAC